MSAYRFFPAGLHATSGAISSLRYSKSKNKNFDARRRGFTAPRDPGGRRAQRDFFMAVALLVHVALRPISYGALYLRGAGRP